MSVITRLNVFMQKIKIIGLICFFFLSCKKETKHIPTCHDETPTYITEIAPILEGKCVECHGYTSPNGVYNSYSSYQPVLDNGKFEAAVLINQSMPQAAPLADAELDLLKCWIDNGYPLE